MGQLLIRPVAMVRSLAPLLMAVGLLGPGLLPSTARAQPDLRSTFPGRRVGGGTRGECNARLIVHLVPPSSVYAPGTPPLLGLLEGPTAQPRPLELRFRPESQPQSARGTAFSERLLPASGPALVLFTGPAAARPTVWESSYRCEDASGGGSPGDGGTGDGSSNGDPLQFVASTSPPALSLLVADATPADTALQARLRQLRARCGGSISRPELAAAFGLGDLLDGAWPDQLPVRCPSP